MPVVSSRRSRAEEAASSRGLGRTVLHDLRHGGIRRTLRRDLQDLYEFYLDVESRARLARMWRLKRWFLQFFWLLKQLILRLSPTRRILLLVSLLLFAQGGFSIRRGELNIDLRANAVSFAVLLVVLMLELKDKLLARQEIEVGRAVQKALLPEVEPSLAGWEFWMFTRPANDVGGDLVDYLHLGDERLGLALGDVAGKGLGAALLMAKLQATLRAFAPESESLAVLGARLNTIFCRDSVPERFATLIYLEVEAGSRQVRLLNAGHPSPIIVRAASREQLPPAALPLGMVPGAEYAEQQVDLEPGDLLLVYSDGLTEAQNSADEFFGEERLLALVPELRGMPAGEAGARLLTEVERFAGDQRQSDDLSLVLARRVAP